MEILKITALGLDLVKKFIDTLKVAPQPHFRYFEKRDISCLKGHYVTLVGLIGGKDKPSPVAYGHIDHEGEKYWLGISVLNAHQGHGYGSQMMKELIQAFNKSSLNLLYLTVDKSNKVAINLYKKCGFITTQEKETYYEMVLSHPTNATSFTLQVSSGEAIDKLSILEIKLDKISDQRRTEVKKEYDIIAPFLKSVIEINQCQFLYKLLKKINLSIWVKQDFFRELAQQNLDEKLRCDLCFQIIEENDQRFRIKNKINHKLKSCLKEQKGYKFTKALVVPHLLTGDQILMIPLVRHLSILYDEVHLLSLKKTLPALQAIYADDPDIKIIECPDKWWRDVEFYKQIGVEKYQEKDIYACGIHTEYLKKVKSVNCAEVPFCFYRHAGLSSTIYWDYFYMNKTPHSRELASLTEGKPYVFTHFNTSTKGDLFTTKDVESHLKKNKDQIVFIDPNVNCYAQGHPFYNMAQKFIGHPIGDYVDTMINASALYLSDSCFFCLAMNLGLKADQCCVRSRAQQTYDYIWSPKYSFNPLQIGFGSDEKRKIFKMF